MEKYEQISSSSEERLEEIQKENNGGCKVEWTSLFSALNRIYFWTVKKNILLKECDIWYQQFFFFKKAYSMMLLWKVS